MHADRINGEDPDGKKGGLILRRLLTSLMLSLLVATLAKAADGVDPLAEVRARFRGTESPILMEYQLGYRFLNFELSRLGRIKLTTTGGLWRHRITGLEVPAVFIDVRVDSADRSPDRKKNRISIHDEMIGVLTLPDLQALVFTKLTDEYLNPILGRSSFSQAVSCYDTQSGVMEYMRRDLIGQEGVCTNLTSPEALLELSRQIRPIMDYLMGQCQTNQERAAKGRDRISVNLDGQVVTLKLMTHREKSPACLNRAKLDSLRIETVPVGKRQNRARDFFSWAIPFNELAGILNDDGLRAAARAAMVESVVPLVVDYELAVGRIRAGLISVILDQAALKPNIVCAASNGCQRSRNVQ
jgi:hypothetical protein